MFYRAVYGPHGEWLVGSEGVTKFEFWLCEDDDIKLVSSPQLHEVHSVTAPQPRVAAEHHARLSEL